MPFTLQRAEQIVKRVLGGDPSVGTVQEIVNSLISWIENSRSWNFLETGQTTIGITAGQPYVYLPDDIRHITGYTATKALVNTLELTSLHQILRMRALRVISSHLHYWAALETPPARTNLLVQTEDFSASEWTSLPDPGDVVPVITADQEVSPLSTEQTADRLHVDATGGNLKWVGQEVALSRLSAGTYVASFYLKKDTSIVHTSDLTKVRLVAQGGTSQTTGHIDWSGATPVVTLVTGESAGTGNAASGVLVGGGWVRVQLVMDYDATEGTGKLESRIYPVEATTETGAVFAFGAQLERTLKSRYESIANVSSVAATRYDAVLGSTRGIPPLPRPALALWPVPTADDDDALSISYVRQIPRVANDSDYIQIPDWMDLLFVDGLQRVAKGWEEHDVGGIAERMEPLARSDLFDGCEDRDADAQPHYGPMLGTHTRRHRGQWLHWDSGRTSSLP